MQMTEPLRVPMPERPSFIGNDDIAAHITRSPKYARRFSMDVAEDALAQMGQSAIPVVVEELAKNIVYRHQTDIAAVVHACLADRSFYAPIIEDELRNVIRAYGKELISLMDLIRAYHEIHRRDEEEEAREDAWIREKAKSEDGADVAAGIVSPFRATPDREGTPHE